MRNGLIWKACRLEPTGPSHQVLLMEFSPSAISALPVTKDGVVGDEEQRCSGDFPRAPPCA